jgi:hypothetical protein
VIRKLHELQHFGWEHLKRNSVPHAPYRGKRKIYRSPTNVDMVRWLGPLFIKKAARRIFRPQLRSALENRHSPQPHAAIRARIGRQA